MWNVYNLTKRVRSSLDRAHRELEGDVAPAGSLRWREEETGRSVGSLGW